MRFTKLSSNAFRETTPLQKPVKTIKLKAIKLKLQFIKW